MALHRAGAVALLALATLSGCGATLIMHATPAPEGYIDPTEYDIPVTKEFQCQACYAAVKEFNKRAGAGYANKRGFDREEVVFDLMSHFCDEAIFFDYSGFPAIFVRNCKAFLDTYNTDSAVERYLVKGGDVGEQCFRICRQACKGMPERDRHAHYDPSDPVGERYIGGGSGGKAPQAGAAGGPTVAASVRTAGNVDAVWAGSGAVPSTQPLPVVDGAAAPSRKAAKRKGKKGAAKAAPDGA